MRLTSESPPMNINVSSKQIAEELIKIYVTFIETNFTLKNPNGILTEDKLLNEIHQKCANYLEQYKLSKYTLEEVLTIKNYILKNFPDIRSIKYNISWLYGEHVLLYDYVICNDCQTVIKTSDEDYEFFIPPYCPICNNIKNSKWSFIKSNTGEHTLTVYHNYSYRLLEDKREIKSNLSSLSFKRMFNNIKDYIEVSIKLKSYIKKYKDLTK